MPLFIKDKQSLNLVKPIKFKNEKELQNLIEENLENIFSCRFVASEFYTGKDHASRIDTLAISEDNSPVIIEYKIVESSQLINQSLYYLSWINNHHGDYEIAVQKVFDKDKVEVDWSEIRVICIAPKYTKYDLHTVKMFKRVNFELWKYRYYENGTFFLEEIYKKSSIRSEAMLTDKNKDPVMVIEGLTAIDKIIFCLKDRNFKFFFEEFKNYNLVMDEGKEYCIQGWRDGRFYINFIYMLYNKLTEGNGKENVFKKHLSSFLKTSGMKTSRTTKKLNNYVDLGLYGFGTENHKYYIQFEELKSFYYEVCEKDLILDKINNIGGVDLSRSHNSHHS